MISLDDVRHEFEFDGTWRDIYVRETDISHWQRVIDAIKHLNCKITYLLWGEPTYLPDAESIYSKPNRGGSLLVVHLGGVDANCHFFGPNEIEFDIDPREVKEQKQLDAIFEFMKVLANATNKPALLTGENCPVAPIFRVAPSDTDVQYLQHR
jgi:hypothetical protein